MNNISMDKKYKYRNGEPARVLCVDGPYVHKPVISITEKSVVIFHYPDGVYAETSWDEDDWDLIEISPYDHIPIDAKVLVWDNLLSDKKKRHFAGVSKNGKPTTWLDGATSWSACESCNPIEWENCKMMEE